MQTLQKRLAYIRGKQPRDTFAPPLGIKPTTWRNYELGTTLPTSDVLISICKILKISPQWLLFGEGPIHLEDTQSALKNTPQSTCAHCAELEDELKTERAERRELAAENRQLWRENGELKERVARLEARIDRHREPPVEASLFDERPSIPSSSQATPLADKPI